MKNIPYLQSILLLLPFLFGDTDCAWALQSHQEPEGMYVHQMAHILFAMTLAYLSWHTRRTPAVTSNGWRYLQIFCVLLIAWNIIAFAGHEAYEHLAPSDFIDQDTWKEQLAMPVNFFKLLYFITKMDHFFITPALLALAISLRTFYLEVSKEPRK